MNKKLFIFGIPLLVVGLVAAAYVFGTFSWTFNVAEPFTVYYYSSTGTSPCVDYSFNTWVYTAINSSTFNLGSLYPGDNKRFCFAINSNAPDNINISATFTGIAGFLQNVQNNIPTVVVANDDTEGDFRFEVMHTANGTFNGQIEFARV